MPQIHTVALRYSKSSKKPVDLSYRQVTLDSRQARLVGREALIPDISLDDYICSAVIDWITIDLHLQRTTQHQWLADAISGFGRRPYIKPIDAGPGTESTHFTIKLQEPDLPELHRIIAAIDRKYRLAAEPVVVGMEVSVDFTPKTPSDEARARMVGMLARQLAPATSVFSKQADMPRIVWGSGTHRWSRIQVADEEDEKEPYRFAVNGIVNVPGADTTSYFGSKYSDDMMRVMDKILDEQNTFTGNNTVLPPEERRCRVEVALKQGKLASMGMRHINDVSRFKFATLQGTYFQFKLATVLPRGGSAGPVHAYRERQRVQKFMTTGISGLAMMDRTLVDQDKKIRPIVRQAAAKQGKVVAARPRAGSGPYGTAVAYEQLCKSVQVALANLSRKLKDQADEADYS